MKAIAYLHGSKDTMYELGESLGLTSEALDQFRYALYEVTIEMDVDPKTGKAKIIAVDGRRLEGVT